MIWNSTNKKCVFNKLKEKTFKRHVPEHTHPIRNAYTELCSNQFLATFQFFCWLILPFGRFFNIITFAFILIFVFNMISFDVTRWWLYVLFYYWLFFRKHIKGVLLNLLGWFFLNRFKGGIITRLFC